MACTVLAAEFGAVGTGASYKESFKDGTGVKKRVLRKAHGSLASHISVLCFAGFKCTC